MEWPGCDYFSVPRSFINLLYGKSIFQTDFFPYGNIATKYYYHPLVSLALGSWLSLFPPVVSFYVFVFLSIGIVIYCGRLLNEILNQEGKEYLLLGCSIATYLLIWSGQIHVFIMLSVVLILNGFHHAKLGNSKLSHKRIITGLLMSLFTKPVIILSIPYLFFLPNFRKKLIISLMVYCLISIIFLIKSPLNPGDNNSIHWQNIIWQSSVVNLSPKIFSIPWIIVKFFDLKELSVELPILFKIPLMISLIPLVGFIKIDKEKIITYSMLGFLLTSISYYLSYTMIWEYHYSSLLPLIIFMIYSGIFINKRLLKFCLFLISMPLIFPGSEGMIFNDTKLLIGKVVKVISISILFYVVINKMRILRIENNS